MSYDLFLGAPRLDARAFADHFAGRPNYISAGCYENDDTGVYFQFTYIDDPIEDEGPIPEEWLTDPTER